MDGNYSILYVDDESALLKVTKLYLEKKGGFLVDTASSVREGLDKIYANSYDAVVSDYEMPETNGIEFLSEVRSTGNDIPFIIFTGRGREDVVIDALNNGADFYLQKGGQPNAQFAELKNKISQAVRRKRAENEIEAGKKQLVALLNAANGGEMLISSKGEILALNRLMAKRMGSDPKVLLGMNAFEELPAGLSNLEEMILGQEFSGYEKVMYNESARGRHYRNTVNPVLDRYGYVTSYAILSLDITDQVNTESSLATAREHLDITLKSIGDGVIVTDENCNIRSLNRIAESLTGWTEKDAVGLPLMEVFRLTDQGTGQELENPALKAMKCGEIVNISGNIQLESKNGEKYIVGDSAAPIVDSDSVIRGSVVVFRNITKEREANEQKHRLASVIESADDAIIATDLNGVILSWNRAAEDIIGYSGEEALGREISFIYTDQYESGLNPVLEKIRSGGKVDHHVTKRKRKDGKIIDISLTVSPVYDECRCITGFSGIMRDITETLRMRKKLEESYEWSSTVLRSIGDAIITTDNNCKITFMNPVAEELTGWKLGEARKKPLSAVFEITNEYTGETVESPVEKVLKEGRVVGLANHTILTGKDGRVSPIDDSGAPIIDGSGRISGAVIVFRDISERKAAEKRLFDSESRYRALFNSTGAATVIIDRKGRILLSNSGYEKLSGFSSSDVDGKMCWMDFVDAESLEEMSKKAGKRDPLSVYHDSYEFTFVDRLGISHDIFLIMEAVEDSENIVCNLIDISKLKKVQKDLFESENKLNTILNSLPDIVVQKDRDLKILWANNAAKDLNPDLLGKTCYEAFLGENKACRECNAKLAIKSGKIRKKTVIHENVKGRGESCWEKTSIPIMDHEGRYSSVVEYTRNVTSRYRSENLTSFRQKLAEEMSAVSYLGDALDMLYGYLTDIPDIDSCLLFLKDDIKGGLSLVKSEGISEEYEESVKYLDPESSCVKRLAAKKPVYGSFDDVSPSLKDVSEYEGIKSFAFVPVVGNDEILGAYFLISRNACEIPEFTREVITSVNELVNSSLTRIKMEDELRESREKLGIALKSAGLYVWDYYAGEGKIKWNNNLLRNLGYSCKDIIDSDWWASLVHPDDQKQRDDELNKVISGSENIYANEYRIRSFDGEWRWLSVLGKAVWHNSEGKAVRLIGVIQDITRQKDNEYALKVANNKLNLLSSITRHDIINQITPALAYLEFSNDICRDNDELTNYLDEIKGCIEVISSHISFTKDYQDLGLELPVWQEVKNVALMAKSKAGLEDISLKVSGLCGDIEVLADPMFEKIFYNLIDNSARHGNGVSEISIHCEKEKNDIRIVYSDDGAGIPDDMKEKIFLKGIGKNTGLGLFLTKEILDITGLGIKENGVFGECAKFEISVPQGRWKPIK